MEKVIKHKSSAGDWFRDILDAYENTGNVWASGTHLTQAVEFYALYEATGDVRYIDECEKYLKVAIPNKR